MNTPTTYLSYSPEHGWTVIHQGGPICKHTTLEMAHEAADACGLMVDELYWDGMGNFIDPFHSNKDEAVELSSYQQYRCTL